MKKLKRKYMPALSVKPKKKAVKQFIETKYKQVKFAPPTPAEKPIKNTQLGIEAERKNLEYLLLKNYIYVVDGSQENITFTKNFSNKLKFSALKFVHENFDTGKASIDKILAKLEAIEPENHIPFAYFNSEEDLAGYGLYNSFQDETIKYASVGSSKGNIYLESIADNREKLNDKLDKGNENLDRRLVIKPNSQIQSVKEDSQDYYKTLQMEPKCDEEFKKDFIKKLRKQYFKLDLKMHPD